MLSDAAGSYPVAVVSIADVAGTPVVSDTDNPKAKRIKLVSEDKSCASDSTSNVTDDERDKDFVLNTPNRRSTDFCFGNGAFIAQKSQMQDLIDQINKTSKCSTKDCNGLLKPVNVQMVGLIWLHC